MTDPTTSRPASMTGFARASGQVGSLSFIWELRSVNSKALDVRSRLPNGFDRLDQIVKSRLQGAFTRGSISVSLTIEREEATPSYRLNEGMVQELLRLAVSLERLGAPKQNLDGLLSVKGVLELEETAAAEDEVSVDGGLTAGLEDAVAALATTRTEEGQRLLPVLSGQLTELETLSDRARGSAAAQPKVLRDRLEKQLTELLQDRQPALPEDRFVQEVALLAAKADIREELDRLSAHLDQARTLLAADEPSGRRLDFLCQELNREANTLCSKSSDLELTNLGLAMKAVIERFREQIQNIE